MVSVMYHAVATDTQEIIALVFVASEVLQAKYSVGII